MKTHLLVFFGLATILFGGISCDYQVAPNLLVRTTHDGHALGQAVVYLKKGAGIDPNLPLDQYELSQRADGQGDAYFANLIDTTYTIVVVGYDPKENNVTVQGRMEVTLSASTRSRTTSVTIEALNAP